MARFLRHIPQQIPSLGATLRLLTSTGATSTGSAVGKRFAREVPPPPSVLLDDFVSFLGGAPSSYRGVVPPHFFCQWTFGPLLEAAHALPYPALRVVNAGCGFKVNAPLPRGEPLAVETVIEAVEDDGYRAKILFKMTTSARTAPNALQSWVTARVALKRRVKSSERKRVATVPLDGRTITELQFGSNAGAEFARLTGDFNPLHYSNIYARSVGFRSKILHGFASFGFCVEGLSRSLLSGASTRLVAVQADFKRPVPLPARSKLLLAQVKESEAGESDPGSQSLANSRTANFFLAPSTGAVSYLEGRATWMSY